MHPYWIQKIEEARRSSVIQFWTVVFLIIVLPILLVMKSDGYMILGLGCFIAAGLRVYWTSETMAERINKSEAAPKPIDPTPLPSAQSGTPPQWQTGHMPSFAGGQTSSFVTGQTSSEPELAARSEALNNGVPSGPYGLSGPTDPAGFFTASIEPGEPLAPQRPQSQPNSVNPGGDQASALATPVETGKPRHFHDFAS